MPVLPSPAAAHGLARPKAGPGRRKGRRWRAHTARDKGGGSRFAITLYLPQDRAYELEVDTSRVGDQFDTELPYSRGCIGTGDIAGRITIRTAVGAVHIRAGVR